MTNRERALHAERALDRFTRDVYGGRDVAELPVEDRQTALSDLLCDLMHYAAREGFEFRAKLLLLAEHHFSYESTFGWDEEVT